MLSVILSIAGGVVAGAILTLKVIAPKTATTVDDRILALLELIKPHLPAPVMKQAVELVSPGDPPRTMIVDHRSK